MASKRDKVKDSERYTILLPNLKTCLICGRNSDIEIHEVFYGTANRTKSKTDGMVVSLCSFHHRGQLGVHNNPQMDDMLKKQAEEIWIQNYAKDKERDAQIKAFIDRYGRNYLDE